jgi:hypothetical protein
MAPMGLACLHQSRLPPRRGGGLCTGTRHWAPALAIGMEFSFSWDPQTIHHLLLRHLLLMATGCCIDHVEEWEHLGYFSRTRNACQ